MVGKITKLLLFSIFHLKHVLFWSRDSKDSKTGDIVKSVLTKLGVKLLLLSFKIMENIVEML